MSRSDGSARPPLPADSDYHVVNAALHHESDELPDINAYEQTLWPILAGEVIQPRCMCGRWSSVGECEHCQAELRVLEQMADADRREQRGRVQWQNWKKPA